MPLLILFGVLLAIKGLTLGNSGASDQFPDANAWDGLNFYGHHSMNLYGI